MDAKLETPIYITLRKMNGLLNVCNVAVHVDSVSHENKTKKLFGVACKPAITRIFRSLDWIYVDAISIVSLRLH